MNIPVILCDAVRADNAFRAHKALLHAERDNPKLKDNPHWTLLRQEAFERFAEAFERV
jgi:hypothetical protein